MRPLLVTAGATRNPIDAIRYLSAHASGRTGVGLAVALSPLTSPLLLGSAEACLRAPQGLPTEEYTSTRDLEARMRHWVLENPDGIVVHSAAVGDYEAEAIEGKIPSGQGELTLRLRPAPKILDQIRGWSPGIFLVSFKAAPPGTSLEELARIAGAQRVRTGSDLVFANAIGRLSAGLLLVEETGAQAFESREAAVAALRGRLERELRPT